MKHLIYIVCVCAVLTGLFMIPVSYAEETDHMLLYDLGILPEDDVSFDEKMTFEQLARMSVTLSNGGKLDKEMDFTDIAVSMGFIPEKSSGGVSSADAARAVMCAAGYKMNNVSDDEYYLRTAVGKGLFSGVSFSDSNAITLGEAAALFENALDIETMITDNNGSKSSGKTVIEDIFGLKTVDGVLYPGEAVGYLEDIVRIGGKDYHTDKNFDNFTGRKIRAYVNADDEAVSVNGRFFKNEIYVISANDIERIENNSIYFIDASGKTVQRKINSKAEEVYNGRLCEYSSGDLDITNGFITLIRHPGTSDYGAVIIKQYDIMLAGGVGNGIIYDYSGSGASVSVNDTKTEVSVSMDGEEISVGDIKRYDVLMMYYTKDREKLKIEVVRNTVTGQISGISDDYIKIGRRIYVTTAYYKENAKQVSLGDEVELILDGAGLAVGFKQNESKESYGYFMGLFYDEATEKMKIRMLTDDGKVGLYSLNNKIKVDGKSVTNSGAASGQLEESLKTLVSCDTGGVKTVRKMNDYVYQLIIYTAGSDGNIKAIDTALELEGENKDRELTLDAYVNANRRFKTDPMQFVDSFGVSVDNTKMFYVPQTDNVFDEYGNVDNEMRKSVSASDYTVITSGWLRNDQDDITANAYNISGGGVAGAVVVQNKDVGKDPEFTDEAAGLFILCDLLESINDDDDEPSYTLRGMLDGKETEYYITKEDFGRMEGKSGEEVFVEPKPGDIMQIKADSDNRVLSYTTRYSGYDNVNYYAYIGNNIWTKFGNFTGYVYDKDDYGFCTVSDVNTLANKRYIMKKGVSRVYIYDMKTDTVSQGSIADLVSYKEYEYGASRIYARTAYGVVNTVIIYVNEEEGV